MARCRVGTDKCFSSRGRRSPTGDKRCSLNKRSFRGLGGVGRGIDSVGGPKSVRGNWRLWFPVVSRGLPWYATRREVIELNLRIFDRNIDIFEV